MTVTMNKVVGGMKKPLSKQQDTAGHLTIPVTYIAFSLFE